jgi:hypothetical protein
MANRLIRVKDIASIARTTVAAEDALLATLDTAAAIANATAVAEEVMLASPETNITINNDEQGNRMSDTGNVAWGKLAVNKEPGVIDEDTDSNDIPELVQAPLADTLSPRTAAMVLEATGPGDGQILLDNAKDLATTLHFLHQRLRANLTRADEAETRAFAAENRIEELEANKENKPPQGRRRRRSNSSSSNNSDSTTVLVCPKGFEENHGQVTGFYIPDDDGTQIEPKFIQFVQGVGTPHAEGTQGRGFPVYRTNLFTPADYTEPNQPLKQMPIWFTAALSHHNHMYNTVLLASLEHNNWGISVDIIHYRNCEDQIGIWEARCRGSHPTSGARPRRAHSSVLPSRGRACPPSLHTPGPRTPWQRFPVRRQPQHGLPPRSVGTPWAQPGGMSEVADDLRPRRGMVKPAGISGFGPGTVRGYDEPARRTGRGLPSPDPYFTFTQRSYSACGLLMLLKASYPLIGHRRLLRIKVQLFDF